VTAPHSARAAASVIAGGRQSSQQTAGITVIQPSGDTSGATDAAAIQAVWNAGGIPELAIGHFYVTGVTANAGAQWLYGSGTWATFLHLVGHGDAIRMYNPVFPVGGGWTGWNKWGGGVKYLTIDGSMAAPGSSGLHIGDGEFYDIDVMVQQFNGAGSAGLLLDNTVSWTEKMRLHALTMDCTTHVQMTVTGGHDSFEYNDFDLVFEAKHNQVGLALANGAYLNNSRVMIRGNFNRASPPNSGLVVSVNGHDTRSGGYYCHITKTDLNIAVEADGDGTGFPQTISIGPGNYIGQCFGRLVFGGPGTVWAPCNVVWGRSSQNSFSGIVLGDANISPAGVSSAGPTNQSWVDANSPAVYSAGTLSGSTGAISDQRADFFTSPSGAIPPVLSANITIGLGGSGGAGSVPAPQRKTIILKQASSGTPGFPFKVTWPRNPSPTTLAPTVLWPGGTAPVMTGAANAVDMYLLETLDGATWYGRAMQNMA
jgi:hypothetical protein